MDNSAAAALGAISPISTFILSPQIRLAESGFAESRYHPGTALWDPVRQRTAAVWTDTVDRDLPRPHRSVEEVLGADQLPDKFTEALLAWL